MTTDQGSFPRANPGDPLRIPAAAWNRMRDATFKVERIADANIGRIFGGKPSPREILLKNATVTDRERYDVMAVSMPLFGPSDNLTEFQTNLCMQGIAPNASTYAGRWAVLLEPIAAGQIGRAIISGDTIALIDINDSDDTHVEIATNDYRLQSGTTGSARILWKESGTGSDKWALIRIGDASGGGSSGAGASAFRIKTINTDSLTCRTWDGSNDGDTDIEIAKPYSLRHSSGNYPWIDSMSLSTVDAQTVTVQKSSVSYTWKVAVPYSVNEVIWAAPTTLADVTVDYVDLVWEDTNRNAHAWSEVQS